MNKGTTLRAREMRVRGGPVSYHLHRQQNLPLRRVLMNRTQVSPCYPLRDLDRGHTGASPKGLFRKR